MGDIPLRPACEVFLNVCTNQAGALTLYIFIHIHLSIIPILVNLYFMYRICCHCRFICCCLVMVLSLFHVCD